MTCQDVALETLCERCNGVGTLPSREDPDRPCPRCEGAGYEPTEFGEKVLELMRHQLRPMLAQLRGE